MSINDLQNIIKSNEEIPKWDDFSDYEGYDYTLRNGKVILVRPWENETDICKLSTKKEIQKPKEPFCYKSIKDFNERKSNKIPMKIWNIKNNFFLGKKTLNETKEKIKQDFDLYLYFNSAENVKGKTYLPYDSFLTYISRQENSSEFNVFNLRDKIYKTAKNICQKNKNLDGKVHEITTALFYNDLLRKILIGENELKDSKNKMQAISEASKLSAKQVRHWTAKLKKEYIKEFIEYKQKNNLLTYSDLKQGENIYGIIIKDRIKEECGNKEINYSAIAKKYGLKNGRVVSKIIRDSYQCQKSDLYEPIKLLTA